MRKNVLCLLVFILFILLNKKTKAQEVLTLEDAIRISLERNYNIKLVSNALEISKNNVSLANAGILPIVGASLTDNHSIQNSKQVRSTGEVTERKEAKSSNLNYGVRLDWTVFDGFRMFARHDQLKELERLSENDLKNAILTNTADVISTYYNLIQQQHQLAALDTAMEISRFRVQTAKNRFEIGRSARLEVLNAQVDFNTDTTNYLRQQELYRNTQIQLNTILARDVNEVFKVSDVISIDESLQLDRLVALALKQNPILIGALISKRIAELDLKQVRANRYPTIGVNTGYNFTESRSALGFATQNTGRGLTYGVTASVNLFNGFLQKRNEKNASLVVDNAQIEFDRLNQEVNAQLSAAFQTYQTNLSLVRLEESNRKIAKQNLDITLEKFRLGSISTVEVRDAQLNYVNAAVRFSNAQYQAKIAEVSLKELAGALNL